MLSRLSESGAQTSASFLKHAQERWQVVFKVRKPAALPDGWALRRGGQGRRKSAGASSGFLTPGPMHPKCKDSPVPTLSSFLPICLSWVAWCKGEKANYLCFFPITSVPHNRYLLSSNCMLRLGAFASVTSHLILTISQ